MSTKIFRWSMRQRRVLSAIILQQLFTYMCVSVMAPFFPKEAAKKGVNPAIIGFIFSVYALTSTILSPITGKFIIPAFGKKRVLLSGCWLSGGAVALFGLLDTVVDRNKFVIMCFAVRIVQAAGVSMYMTSGFAYLAVTFREDLGVVMGLSEMSVGIGFMLGPTIGGQLFQVGGYKLPFLVMGGILMLSLPVSYCLLPGDEHEQDATSSMEESSGDNDDYDVSISHAYADITEPWASSTTRLLRKNTAQILQRAARRPTWSWRFMFFIGYVTLNAISISFYETTLEPHLRPLGLDAGRIGILFVVSAIFYFVFGIIVGFATDASACRRVRLTVLGMILQALAFLLLGPSPILKLQNEVGMNIVALATIGTSFAFSLIPTFAILFDAYEERRPTSKNAQQISRRYALVAGLWQSAYSLGEFIGPATGGVLLHYLGYPIATSIMALLCAFCALSLAVADRVSPEQEQTASDCVSRTSGVPQQHMAMTGKSTRGLTNSPGNGTLENCPTVLGGRYGSLREQYK